MLNDIQFRFLQWLCPGDRFSRKSQECAHEGGSKIDVLLGEELLRQIRGKVVIDFGCGGGAEAIEFARQGALRVIGIDIREEVLAVARQRAVAAGVSDICTFSARTEVLAETIVTIDAFEHFDDPAQILRIMRSLLRSDGQVIFSFGPPWFHPLGGHLFSIFPWAHLLVSEEALCRWRATFKTDGARKFREVAGGLNEMSIGRFERLVAASPFRVAAIETVPIVKFRALHNKVTREFLTSVVRGRLVPRD
jgi:SAM-dependent methyltransferase